MTSDENPIVPDGGRAGDTPGGVPRPASMDRRLAARGRPGAGSGPDGATPDGGQPVTGSATPGTPGWGKAEVPPAAHPEAAAEALLGAQPVVSDEAETVDLAVAPGLGATGKWDSADAMPPSATKPAAQGHRGKPGSPAHRALPLEAAAEEEPKKKRRVGSVLLIILSVALIAGGVTLAIQSFIPQAVPSGALTDPAGNVIIPDDPSATDPAFVEQAEMVVNDGGAGFEIPSVYLHVPLGSVNDVGGKMNPPNYTSAFWIRNRGVGLDKAETGTVYIVAHSAHGGKAPGNYVQDKEKSTVMVGDRINVNDRAYTVEQTEIIPIKELGTHTEIWDDVVPGRLVFVTCIQNTVSNNPTDNNLVIIGKLVS